MNMCPFGAVSIVWWFRSAHLGKMVEFSTASTCLSFCRARVSRVRPGVSTLSTGVRFCVLLCYSVWLLLSVVSCVHVFTNVLNDFHCA